jgi:hypothetical protein
MRVLKARIELEESSQLANKCKQPQAADGQTWHVTSELSGFNAVTTARGEIREPQRVIWPAQMLAGRTLEPSSALSDVTSSYLQRCSKVSSAGNRTRRFTAICTKARHCTRNLASSIHTTPLPKTHLNILCLLCLPSGRFLSFLVNILCVLLVCPKLYCKY